MFCLKSLQAESYLLLPQIEPVEERRLLTVFTIDGTANADTITLYLDTGVLKVNKNGTVTSYPTATATDTFVINGLAGGDAITNNTSNPTQLNGGDHSDTINGGSGTDNIDGGEGNDTLNGNAGADAINGNNGLDVLTGGNGPDVCYGGDGADWIDAGDDNDLLYGELGDDWMYGGEGDDELDVRTTVTGGNDTYIGGNGDDDIGSWYQNLIPPDGTDVFYGGGGNDEFWSNDGTAESVFGEDGNDTVHADGGDMLSSIETVL